MAEHNSDSSAVHGPGIWTLNGVSLAREGVAVLQDINLRIDAGERVALIGPSGAGKSTLLELLFRQQRANCALCPQQAGLVDILSVYNNVFMGALERHSALYNFINLIRPWSQHKTAIAQLCAELGLEQKLWHSPDRLSGGQRQRVAIARALYRQQPLLIADEPLAALDPKRARAALELLLARHQTSVVSLHDRHLAREYFPRLVALRNGRIVFDGPGEQLSEAQLDAIYAH